MLLAKLIQALSIMKALIFCVWSMKNGKSIYIPKLTIGEEKILLPAIHLPELRSIEPIVEDSSAGDCGKI